MTYILVDSLNMFYRARHVVRGDDIETKIGMAYHIMFSAVNKAWKDFNGSHVVFCFEGRSWRKDHYEPYKRNRKEARDALSPREQEEDRAYFEAFDELKTFIEKRTNCTVLQHPTCEADDFIARFIQNHPNDEHVIISSDSDFYQLLANNVSQYNGITNQHIRLDGVYDDKGKPVVDKKTKEHKVVGDPEWLLFEKCIRGDTSDNIFSAYPGARKKGTKNKVGLLEAFEDKNDKGFNWNNFMLQKWVDHEGVEHRVLDDYQRNRELIDLTAQPTEIKSVLDETIVNQVQRVPVSGVGIHFMKFCGKHDLQRVSAQAEAHAEYLNAAY
jgi:5'-3' exonuclease